MIILYVQIVHGLINKLIYKFKLKNIFASKFQVEQAGDQTTSSYLQGPIAKQFKSSNNLGRGWGDPSLNLGGGMFF